MLKTPSRPVPILPLRGRRVVVASNDPETLGLIVPTLRSAGAAALPAATAASAWALSIQVQDLDLLIAHTAQPDSLELVSRLHRWDPNLALLYVVGPKSYARSFSGTVPHGLLIREPFSPNVLLRSVVHLLDGHRAA